MGAPKYRLGSVIVTLTLGVSLSAPNTTASAACATSIDPGGDASRLSTDAVCCVVATDYSLSATSSRIPFFGIPVFKDGPGGQR